VSSILTNSLPAFLKRHFVQHTLSANAADNVNSDTTPGKNEKERAAGDVISPVRPRQQGCPAYEALAGVERVDVRPSTDHLYLSPADQMSLGIQYCLNVLLPEAILQLLLWRSGERTSVELLSEEEEQALHDVGEEKLRETDWVFDVVRLRESKMRQLARASGKRKAEEGTGDAANGGTMSRPRRSTGLRRY